jgi:hypothetical protein
MWQQLAAQTFGEAVKGESKSGDAISSIGGFSFSADAATISTGGGRASGANVSKAGDPLSAATAAVGSIAGNPTTLMIIAGALVLAVALTGRKR